MGKDGGSMSLLDVRKMAFELQKLIGMRTVNIYSVSKRIFTFKLVQQSNKSLLLVESGSRMHTTKYERDKDTMPNMFCAKIRKHVKGKRIESIQQLGMDRVVDFQFGVGESAFHIIFEFYNSGNIILTDWTYKILGLLRSHSYGKETEEEKVAVGSFYPMNFTKPLDQESITKEFVLSIFEGHMRQDDDETLDEEKGSDMLEASILPSPNMPTPVQQNSGKGSQQRKLNKTQRRKLLRQSKFTEVIQSKQKKKATKKSKKEISLKVIFANALHFGPAMVRHCMLKVGLSPTLALPHGADILREKAAELAKEFRAMLILFGKLGKENSPGYIISKVQQQKSRSAPREGKASNKAKKKGMKQKRGGSAQSAVDNLVKCVRHEAEKDLDKMIGLASDENDTTPSQQNPDKAKKEIAVYHEYIPWLLHQHASLKDSDLSENLSLTEFPDLDTAMDEFYSKAESQKAAFRDLKEKEAAWKKVERVKDHHREQVLDLKVTQSLNERQAQLIEDNFEAVDQTLEALNLELAKGSDWRDIERLIKQEKLNNNPMALIVEALHLKQNKVTLLLSEGLIHLCLSEEELKAAPDMGPIPIKLDLTLSAHVNAARYYAIKKKAVAKADKTSNSSVKAIKAAERKVVQQLKEVEIRQSIKKMRKVHWFEKFFWFVTSENYLVIGGRDMQQNEQIVKKHMDPHDIYFHADMHGASSVVLKNPTKSPVPSFSLVQAAGFTVCRSSAWKTKTPGSAYWVFGHQVSKTPPTGEYLPTGSFMIRGKKNRMPQQPLVMGLAVLFRLDPTSQINHVGERKPKSEAMEISDESNGKKQPKAQWNIENLDSDDDDLDLTGHLARQKSFSGAQGYSSSLPDSTAPDFSPNFRIDQEEGKKFFEPKSVQKPRMSAAEKRKRKKNLQRGQDESVTSNKQETNAQTKESQIKVKPLRQTESNGKPQGKGQGKKRERKRAGKYEDQDEEDIQLANAMYGVKAPTEDFCTDSHIPPSETQQTRSQDNASEAVLQRIAEAESTRLCFFCQKPGHLFRDCPNRDEGSGQSFSQAKKMAKDRDPEEGPDQVVDASAEINTLTGKPTEEDDLLYGVPMCAPLSALTDYKYRIKLLPVTGGVGGKKGRAAKQAIELFTRNSGCTLAEKELLRALGDNEVMLALPSGVKLAAAGLGAIKASKKAKQKSAAKKKENKL